MTLAGKIVTVIVLKAVLLGLEPGDRVLTDGYVMARWGSQCGDAAGNTWYQAPKLTGERVLQDNLAGLTIVVAPSGSTERDMFGEQFGGQFGVQPDIQEQILRPAEDGSWPDAEFDFPIPRTGSAYFMEEVEENLFRRIEFSGRAGIGARLGMTPVADGVGIDLQLNKRLLSGSSFEETLDAWLGKPTLTRVTLGTQLLLPTNKQVLVVVAPGGAGSGRNQDQTMPAGAAPLGLAMLLEMRQWEFLLASPELRREFEPLAKTLGAATGGRARLDLQNTHTPPTPDLSSGVTPPEHGYLTVVPITTQGDEPALITEGEEQYAPIMALRVARDAGVWLWQDTAEAGSRSAGTRRFDICRLTPGVYLLAQGQSGNTQQTLFAANEDGSALTKVRSSSSGSGGSDHYEPPTGAPQVSFAEFERWGSIGGGALGANFRVWFPSGGADEPRQSITVTVAEPDAPQGGVFGRG
jgi:hypothetical protein